MSQGERFLTTRELRKSYGVALSPNNFITTPGACENPAMFIPTIEVPAHLMGEKQAENARKALLECQQIVGGWGEQGSKFDSDEFQKAADKFKLATGVEARDVFELAFSAFTSR